MEIDITKKYKTRDGQDFTPLSDKGRGNYPIIGFIGSAKVIQRWSKDGRFVGWPQEHHFDLVEVKEKKVAYLNVYPDSHRSRNIADAYAAENRIACVRIEYEEGQFDE